MYTEKLYLEGFTHLWTSVVVLLMVVIRVHAQSPCGSNTITISIHEYPKVQTPIVIPNGEQSTYRSLLVSRSSDDLILIPSKDNVDNNTSDDPSTLFKVEYLPIVPQGYYLTMIMGLDRDGPTESADDDRNTLQFTLECKLSGTTSAQETYYHVLKIQIQDLNDNAPQFRGEPYSIAVNELTPTGTTIVTISATDLDRGNNKLVLYNILSVTNSQFNGNGVFILPSPDNPYVVLNHELDYEAMVNQGGNSTLTIYTMNVTATDRSTEFMPQSNWTEIIFTITDGDDQGPEFIYPSCLNNSLKSCVHPRYDATVLSGTDVTKSLTFMPVPRLSGDPTQPVVIKARDGDTLNATIQFQMAYTVPTGYDNYFLISTSRVGTSNEYQCNVLLQTAISTVNVSNLIVVIVAIEQTPVNRYQKEAVISLTIQQNGGNDSQTSTSTTGTARGNGQSVWLTPESSAGLTLGVVFAVLLPSLLLWALQRKGIICAKVNEKSKRGVDQPLQLLFTEERYYDSIHINGFPGATNDQVEQVTQITPEYTRIQQITPDYTITQQNTPGYTTLQQNALEYTSTQQTTPDYTTVNQSIPEYETLQETQVKLFT